MSRQASGRPHKEGSGSSKRGGGIAGPAVAGFTGSRGSHADALSAGSQGPRRVIPHQARAQHFYQRPKPFFEGWQEYEEHPMLVDRTCFSFNAPKEGQHQRWREADLDTGQGKCRFHHDCRQGDGPQHTDPKMERMRDRLDSRGVLVLVPVRHNVPYDRIDQERYREQELPKSTFEKARAPPFKGAGGARTPMWQPIVEVGLGHGHGVFPCQQHKEEHGRVPFGQYVKRYELALMPQRMSLVRSTFLKLGGRLQQGAADQQETGSINVEALVRRYNAGRTRDVIGRQKSEEQARREVADFFGGQSHDTKEAPYDRFLQYCDAISAAISNDGYFALQLANLWGPP